MKKIFLPLFFTLFFTHSFSVFAQLDPCVRTSEGQEFWVGFMEHAGNAGVNTRLYVTSRIAATGTVNSGGGTNFVSNINVAANGSQLIELPPNDVIVDNPQTPQARGVFVTTTEDVSLYALNRKLNSADATLIFPLQALGTEYYTISYTPNGWGTLFLVVATEDNTAVTIVPSKNTSTGSLAGIPINVTLERGETYLVRSPGTIGVNNDLTGSYVNSDKPVAVFSGNIRVNIDGSSSDHLYEQLPSVNTWGRSFVTIPSVRDNPAVLRAYDYFRIMAQEDGTTVTISGQPAAVTLNAGEYHTFNTTGNNVPRVINADKPVMVGQLTISQQVGEDADPYFIILSPNQQTLENINLEALVTGNIDTYHIDVVTKTTNTGNIRLDATPMAFTAIAGSEMSYGRRNVTPGTHTLTNSDPANDGFIAYVYGYGNFESYGYLAGTSLETVVDVADDVAYCEGITSDRTLEAPDGFISYEWRLIPNPAILSIDQDFTVTVSGKYELVTETAEGCVKKDTTEVIFSPPAVADIKYNGVSTDEIRFCDSLGQQTITGFNIANGPLNLYKWRVAGSPTVIATTPELIVNNFSATTVYELEVTNSADQCTSEDRGSAFDIITVIFEPTHDVDIAFDGLNPDFLNFCNSEGPQTITASLIPLPADVTYQWFENGVLMPTETTNELTVHQISATTRYKVEALRPAQTLSCPQTDEIVVTFGAGVIVDIANNGSIVSADTLILCDPEGAQTLSAFNPANPANVTYQWFQRDDSLQALPALPFDVTSSVVADNLSDSTYYTVVITDINTPANCSDTAHVSVFFRPQPIATIYLNDEIVAAPAVLNFCDEEGEQFLRIDSLNNPDRVVVEWYNDATNELLATGVNSIIVKEYSSTTTYRVETVQETCSDIDIIEVKFFPSATIQYADVIAGDKLFFCDAQGAQTITGGYPASTAIVGYQWRDITDPSNIIDLGTDIDLVVSNFSDTTIYEVELIDIGNGLFPSCQLTDIVEVIFFGNQSAQIREVGTTATPDTLMYCAADGARDLEIPIPTELQLVTDIKWFELNGAAQTQIGNTSVLNVNAFQANKKITKTYIARLTNTLTDCEVEDTMTVVFLPPLSVVLTGSTDICDGNETPITFRLSGAFPMKLTYREIPKVGAPTVKEVFIGTTTTVSPFSYVVQSKGGTFEVLALRDTICSLTPIPSDIVEVTVTPKPDVLISSPDTSICVNQTTKFVADGATNYIFYKNGLPMPAGTVANEYEPIAGTFVNGDKVWVIGETNGCPDTSRVMTMIVYPLPVVDLGVDRYKCKTDTTLLIAPEGDFIYDWKKIDVDGSIISVGNGNDTLFALDTGTYFIRLENILTGCSTTSNRVKVFNFDDEVVVDLGEDRTVCDPSDLPYRLVGSDLSHLNGTTYKWYIAGENTVIGTDSTFDITTENTYSVVIEDPRGCQISDTVRINFAPTPDFVITGHENPNCSTFDTLRIERTNVRNMTINWFGNGIVSLSDSNKVAIVNVSGIYTARVTDNNTSANCSYTQSVEVFVRPNIDLGLVSTTASDTVRLCEGDSLVLDAFRPEHNDNFMYQWRIIENNQVVSTNSKIAINYGMVENYVANRFEVTVTDPNRAGGGNCSVLDTINVRFDRKSGVQIDSTFIKTLCLGQTQTLRATGADSYQWSNGAATQNIEITPTEAGFYTFIVKGTFTTPNLCGASADTIKFRVVPVPEIDIPENLVICETDSVEINAFLPSHEPRYIYEWVNENTGEIIDTLATHIFKQDTLDINYEPQTYRVGVYDTLGGGRCGAESLITVIFNRTSKTEITASDTLVCIGEEITLRATGATNFRWNTGETTQEITVSSDSAGVFRYTVLGSYGDATNQNVCDSTGTSILIQFKDIPKITLNKPDTISICTGDSVQFIAKGGFTYTWSHSPAASGDTVVVFPTDTTSYVVTGFDTLGCSSTDTTVVLVQPQIDLGSEQQLCEGDTAIIGAPRPYGATYLWNTGQTSDTIRVRRSGLYYVEVSINECSYTDSVQIDFIEPPILFAKDTILCFEDENSDRIFHQIGVSIRNYDSTARYRYQWFDENEKLVGQDSLLSIEFGGVYLARVTVEYANSCTAITSLAVEANCDPQVFIPEAFTPNQDRLNEEWEIFGRFYSNLRINVIDRWGMEIYAAIQKRSTDEIQFWDGTYKGKKVPAGVYYYEITYTSPTDKSKTIKQTGTVTVIY